MFKKILFIATLFLCFHEQSAHAQQAASIAEAYRWQAKIEEVKMFKDQGIPFLSWDKEIILVESTAFLHFTNIQGKFSENI